MASFHKETLEILEGRVLPQRQISNPNDLNDERTTNDTSSHIRRPRKKRVPNASRPAEVSLQRPVEAANEHVATPQRPTPVEAGPPTAQNPRTSITDDDDDSRIPRHLGNTRNIKKHTFDTMKENHVPQHFIYTVLESLIIETPRDENGSVKKNWIQCLHDYQMLGVNDWIDILSREETDSLCYKYCNRPFRGQRSCSYSECTGRGEEKNDGRGARIAGSAFLELDPENRSRGGFTFTEFHGREFKREVGGWRDGDELYMEGEYGFLLRFEDHFNMDRPEEYVIRCSDQSDMGTLKLVLERAGGLEEPSLRMEDVRTSHPESSNINQTGTESTVQPRLHGTQSHTVAPDQPTVEDDPRHYTLIPLTPEQMPPNATNESIATEISKSHNFRGTFSHILEYKGMKYAVYITTDMDILDLLPRGRDDGGWDYDSLPDQDGILELLIARHGKFRPGIAIMVDGPERVVHFLQPRDSARAQAARGVEIAREVSLQHGTPIKVSGTSNLVSTTDIEVECSNSSSKEGRFDGSGNCLAGQNQSVNLKESNSTSRHMDAGDSSSSAEQPDLTTGSNKREYSSLQCDRLAVQKGRLFPHVDGSELKTISEHGVRVQQQTRLYQSERDAKEHREMLRREGIAVVDFADPPSKNVVDKKEVIAELVNAVGEPEELSLQTTSTPKLDRDGGAWNSDEDTNTDSKSSMILSEENDQGAEITSSDGMSGSGDEASQAGMSPEDLRMLEVQTEDWRKTICIAPGTDITSGKDAKREDDGISSTKETCTKKEDSFTEEGEGWQQTINDGTSFDLEDGNSNPIQEDHTKDANYDEELAREMAVFGGGMQDHRTQDPRSQYQDDNHTKDTDYDEELAREMAVFGGGMQNHRTQDPRSQNSFGIVGRVSGAKEDDYFKGISPTESEYEATFQTQKEKLV